MFDSLFRSTSDGIVFGDMERTFVLVNDAACRMFGYQRDEFVGLSARALYARPELFEEIGRRQFNRDRGALLKPFEHEFRRKDGSTFWAETVTTLMTDENGEAIGTYAIVRDITERRLAEQALLEALEEVERLKDRLEAENVYLRDEINITHGFQDLIGQSEVFQRVLHGVEQVAPTDATVLILGESGTGKELLARAVHEASRRRERPLVKVNCAALPADLVESELFGHEKGAFTGATQRRVGRFGLADGGTIFLDEIGDLPLHLQAKLLRVLQEGEFEPVGSAQTVKVNVRVIAATNRDLAAAVREGVFRHDLFYRLNVFPIVSPPLRERREDISLLAQHLILKHTRRLGHEIETVPSAVMEALQSYDWPGNVRELANVIERAIILSPGSTLRLAEPLRGTGVQELELKRPRTMREAQSQVLLEALEACDWVIEGPRGAATRLDMPPSTLRDRIERYGLDRQS